MASSDAQIPVSNKLEETTNSPEQTPTPAATPAAAPSANAPAGFEIVKVRKPDGSIVKVKRPIAGATPTPSAADSSENATTTPATDNGAAKTAATTPAGQVKYQIVKVRKPDGTIVKAKRPIPESTEASAEIKPVPAPAPAQATATATSQPAPKPEINQASAPSLTQDNTKPTSPQPKPSTTSVPTSTTPAPSGARASAQTFLLASKLGRLHNSVSKIVGIYDPDFDLYDDVEAGDEFLSDVDDDWDNDDDDVYSDADEDDLERDNTAMDQDHEVAGQHANSGSGNGASRGANPTAIGTHLGQSVAQAVATAPSRPTAGGAPPPIAQPKAEPAVTEKEVQEDSEDPVKKRTRPMGRDLHRRSSRVMSIIIWFIMIVFPVLYIILGILTAVLNGQTADNARNRTYNHMGAGVSQAITIAISAWPIIFAAIAAQTLKAFATYRVERGIKLMTLEQLISSHSLAGAIKQPFFLRKIDLVSIALLCLWALSPLASQAMLRMLYSGTSTNTGTWNAYYVNTTTADNQAFNQLATDSGYYGNDVNSLFGAALLPASSNEMLAEDPYLYPQIPNMKYLSPDIKPDSDGWYSDDGLVAMVLNDTAFSSFYGIPIAGLYDNSSYQFMISSSYMEFDCPFWNLSTMAQINSTGVNLKPSLKASGLYMDIRPPQQGVPGVLTYASETYNKTDGMDSTFTYSVCSFKQTYVDSIIECPGHNDCTVNAIRYTPNPPQHTSNMTDKMDELFLNVSSINIALGTNDGITLTELYILDPTDPGGQTVESNIPALNITLATFEQRLSFIFNTLWLLGYAPAYQTGNFPTDPGWSVVPVVTQAIYQSNAQVYIVNWAWLSILFVCSVILLIAALSFVYWDLNTIAPDILGFASSIVRASKYVNLPKGDTTTSGPERARLLGDVEVMMQDVRPKGEVGRIALGTVREGSVRLERGRFYR